MERKIALAVALLCLATVGLPVAQAAHFTFYHTLGMHAEIGSFEPASTDANNRNGPRVDDDRPIPAEGDVPARFRGLTDILAGGGGAVLDHQTYGSTVEAGHVVPTSYYLSNVPGQPRTGPSSVHVLWFGNFRDTNANGVIDDEWCPGNGGFCTQTDEFQWRGDNTDETFQAFAWFFPGDYDGSLGSTAHFEPAGFAGDCALYQDNEGCINPAYDMTYADSTDNSLNGLNQRWAGNNGGGALTLEEFLVVNQHVVSVIGSPSLIESASAERFKVDCGAADGCFRDYDWSQALAGDDVDSLYRGLTRPVRDALWAPLEHQPLPYIPNDQYFVCPQAIPGESLGCVKDTRHLDARADGGSSLKAWTRQTFDTVVPMFANTPVIGPLPPQGAYGDLVALRHPLAPHSTYNHGAFVRVTGQAWLWDDANGDGYIGAPKAEELLLYGMGLESSPNNSGSCDVAAGGLCELIPRADAYDGKAVNVAPGAAGWPPGTLLLRNYETAYWSVAGLREGPWLDGAPAGSQVVSLRMDPERCKVGYFACRSVDALFLPAGSLNGLSGQVVGGVTVSWTEGTAAHSVSTSGAFSSAL